MLRLGPTLLYVTACRGSTQSVDQQYVMHVDGLRCRHAIVDHQTVRELLLMQCD